MKQKKKRNKKYIPKNETNLEWHTKKWKILYPPFLASWLNISSSAWYDKRLPEMLWAVLIVWNLEREVALNFFRYIWKFVESNKDYSDVTITGISKLSDIQQNEFIKYITSYSADVNQILKSLLFYPELPWLITWSKYLEKTDSEESWRVLSEWVAKTFWHQSQEATDCRWVKVLCLVLWWKIKYNIWMEEQVRWILEYPNYWDMKSVRPNIRATEIADLSSINWGGSDWYKHFWKYSLDNTQCIPEEEVNEKIKNRQNDLSKEIEDVRNHYFEETSRVRHELISHFFENMNNTFIDSRYETSFWIAFYSLSLFIETIFYKTSLSITGRLSLRWLAEILITFKYLIEKEKIETAIWDDFRIYWSWQIKLIYQKLEELWFDWSSMNVDDLYDIANEDKWVEFTPINLWHWDSIDLRKMSIEVWLKDVYDKYYNYTSGFVHWNWWAIRESIYQKCVNPLHRYHRIPTYDLPLMPSVTNDAIDIINQILNLLSIAYPWKNINIKQL